MGVFLDSVPFSGIIRIRDMMYGVTDPFRLDQGDVSFDAPESVKEAMHRAIDGNKSHYLQTTGVPRLLVRGRGLVQLGQTPPAQRGRMGGRGKLRTAGRQAVRRAAALPVGQ